MLDVAALQQENAALRAQLAQLVGTTAKLNERVAELLAVAQRKQRKPSPPKPPEFPTKTKEKKPRPPPTGRKALPKHLPLDAHSLRPDECAHCGSTALDVADVVEEEKLDVVKEHQRRRVVKRTTCRCRDCGERTTPRSLPAPYERSKVTCGWLAWLVMTKFSMLTPLDRTRRDLRHQTHAASAPAILKCMFPRLQGRVLPARHVWLQVVPDRLDRGPCAMLRAWLRVRRVRAFPFRPPSSLSQQAD